MTEPLTYQIRVDWRHWLLGVTWSTEILTGRKKRFTAIHLGPLCCIITKEL